MCSCFNQQSSSQLYTQCIIKCKLHITPPTSDDAGDESEDEDDFLLTVPDDSAGSSTLKSHIILLLSIASELKGHKIKYKTNKNTKKTLKQLSECQYKNAICVIYVYNSIYKQELQVFPVIAIYPSHWTQSTRVLVCTHNSN